MHSFAEWLVESEGQTEWDETLVACSLSNVILITYLRTSFYM